MTKTGKIIITIAILIIGALLLGFAKSVAPDSWWIRVLIGGTGGAFAVWMWTDKAGKG